MAIHESGENYLEEVLVLSKQSAKVRAIDLCAALGFSRPTVSVMLRQLRADGFLTVGTDGGITLTPAGEAVANRIYERHCVIAKALMALGVSREAALQDACKIEHDISDETFAHIREHVIRYEEK